MASPAVAAGIQTATTTITLVDGVRVVVPDSLQLNTPYVLMEQQDWFEVEIRFLRRLLQSGQLALNQHAENNALASGKRSTGASETVPVVTLDHGMERYGWCDIGFLKLDAEGEESNILRGGKRFFCRVVATGSVRNKGG